MAISPIPAYIEWVRPDDDGPGANKVLWTIDTLPALLEKVGFETTPLEYFSRDGSFVEYPWSPADGPDRALAPQRQAQHPAGDQVHITDHRRCSAATAQASRLIHPRRPWSAGSRGAPPDSQFSAGRLTAVQRFKAVFILCR
jgi:hypothetical protein